MYSLTKHRLHVLIKIDNTYRKMFSSCHEYGTKEKFWVPTRNRTSDLRILRSDSLSYSIYKHESNDIADPCSMQDACHTNFIKELARHRVSVVEHRRTEFDGLRFDSSWELDNFFYCPTLVRGWKISFSISLRSSKLTISVILLIKLVGKLLQLIIRYTYTSLLAVYLPYKKAS